MSVINVTSNAQVQSAVESAKPGDTVQISASVTQGFDINGSQFGGTAAAPITIIYGTGDYRSNTGIITGIPTNHSQYAHLNIENTAGYYILKGFRAKGDGVALKANIRVAGSKGCQILACEASNGFTGIFAGLADGIVVDDCYSHDSSQQHNVYISGTNGYRVTRNKCVNAVWNNLHFNVSDGSNTINTNGFISGNDCSGATLAAMDVTGANFCKFINNLVRNAGRHSIVFQNTNQNATPACHDNQVINNTLLGSGWAIAFGGIANAGNGKNFTGFNNILIGASGAVGLSSATGPLDPTCKLSNNIADKVVPTGLFIGSGDYHLAANSPAADKGIASFNGQSAPVLDIAGNPFGTADIGCYASGPPAPPQPVSITLTDAVARKSGDCNGDGKVDIQDLTIVSNNWQAIYDPTTGTYHK